MNDLIFCTLFDSNYLDKGIALYNSMLRVMDSFKLYIFAFDEKSEEILRRKQFKNVYMCITESLHNRDWCNVVNQLHFNFKKERKKYL